MGFNSAFKGLMWSEKVLALWNGLRHRSVSSDAAVRCRVASLAINGTPCVVISSLLMLSFHLQQCVTTGVLHVTCTHFSFSWYVSHVPSISFFTSSCLECQCQCWDRHHQPSYYVMCPTYLYFTQRLVLATSVHVALRVRNMKLVYLEKLSV